MGMIFLAILSFIAGYIIAILLIYNSAQQTGYLAISENYDFICKLKKDIERGQHIIFLKIDPYFYERYEYIKKNKYRD